MHPIVIYELVKARMELDREAERRRLAETEMPRVQRGPSNRRPARKWWCGAISLYSWIRASSGDRGQRSGLGVGLPQAAHESEVRPRPLAGPR
jgi:hypothetical protein